LSFYTCSHMRFLLDLLFYFLLIPPPPPSTLFPYTTLFRSPYWKAARRLSRPRSQVRKSPKVRKSPRRRTTWTPAHTSPTRSRKRSEEHTSELQSPDHLVCRLLLEKKKEYRV